MMHAVYRTEERSIPKNEEQSRQGSPSLPVNEQGPPSSLPIGEQSG
jgi:hypothetical protein